MSMVHRVEEYRDSTEGLYVIVSFRTEFRGIWQCWFIDGELREVVSEPSMALLKEAEQDEIEEVLPLVFYDTHGELPNL